MGLPMNSPVRLGVSPAASSTLTGFYSQRFWGILSLCWNPGLHGLSCSQLFLLVYLHTNVVLPCLPGTALLCVLSTWLPVSTPPTSLDECFFFNSLVVGLPYRSIFWQFWFLNLLLSFFWLYKEAQCVYLRLHLGRKLSVHQFLKVILEIHCYD